MKEEYIFRLGSETPDLGAFLKSRIGSGSKINSLRSPIYWV
jgi:hypothetical protein